jgi:hypothetical protein
MHAALQGIYSAAARALLRAGGLLLVSVGRAAFSASR